MIQPKYNPEEALQRVKLMMGYDLKKSLRENNEVIFEQSNVISPEDEEIRSSLTAAAVGPGTRVGNFISALKKIETPEQFWRINSDLKHKGSELDFEELVNDEMESDNGRDVQNIIDYLKKIGIDSTAEITKTAGYAPSFKENTFKITTAPNTSSTNKTQENLSERQKNINDNFCKVKNGVIVNASSQNNGMPWDNFVKAYSVTNEEIETAKKSCGKKNIIKKIPTYTACKPGQYKRGCKSDVVKQVQACLGMPVKYQTGNFGPITQSNLQKLGKGFENGFTDKDVDTICAKEVKGTEPQIGGEETTIDISNLNF